MFFSSFLLSIHASPVFMHRRFVFLGSFRFAADDQHERAAEHCALIEQLLGLANLNWDQPCPNSFLKEPAAC